MIPNISNNTFVINYGMQSDKACFYLSLRDFILIGRHAKIDVCDNLYCWYEIILTKWLNVNAAG